MTNVATRSADAAAPAGDADERLPLRVVDPEAERVVPPRRTPVRRGMHMVVVLVLLVAAAVVGVRFGPDFIARLGEEPAPAAAEPANVVVGLGTLMPRTEVITVAPPYGAADARIAELLVEEGDRVAAGQTLAVLDNRETLEAAVESARATVEARQAALAQVRNDVRASRDEARAALSGAGAGLAVARREFERGQELVRNRVIATSVQETREAAFLEAEQEVARARASLARFDYDDVDAQPDVVVAARNIDTAVADLARAEADLRKGAIVAPVAGTILTIHARVGETAGTEGLLNLGDTDAMMVRIEVYQTEIGKVALGDPVTVTAAALPQTLTGTVTRIGLEVQRQELVDEDPAANTDARVFRVWADLDEASTDVAAVFVNLQVRARIGEAKGGAAEGGE
jgi:HlyD family secretion protein